MESPVPPQQDPASNEVVGFTVANARRVAEATRYVERFYRGQGAGVPGGYRGGTVPGVIAKATTSIGARSGATYGTGTIQFQKDDGSALSDDTDRPTTGAKNLLNKTIASGSYLIVEWALGAWWVVAVGDCANLS